MATQANFRQRQNLARFPGITPARPSASPAPQHGSGLPEEPSTNGRHDTNGKQPSIAESGQPSRNPVAVENEGQNLAAQPSLDSPASIEEADVVLEIERGRNGAQSPSNTGCPSVLHDWIPEEDPIDQLPQMSSPASGIIPLQVFLRF